jgi:hypothetical protein
MASGISLKTMNPWPGRALNKLPFLAAARTLTVVVEGKTDKIFLEPFISKTVSESGGHFNRVNIIFPSQDLDGSLPSDRRANVLHAASDFETSRQAVISAETEFRDSIGRLGNLKAVPFSLLCVADADALALETDGESTRNLLFLDLADDHSERAPDLESFVLCSIEKLESASAPNARPELTLEEFHRLLATVRDAASYSNSIRVAAEALKNSQKEGNWNCSFRCLPKRDSIPSSWFKFKSATSDGNRTDVHFDEETCHNEIKNWFLEVNKHIRHDRRDDIWLDICTRAAALRAASADSWKLSHGHTSELFLGHLIDRVTGESLDYSKVKQFTAEWFDSVDWRERPFFRSVARFLKEANASILGLSESRA